MLKAAINEEQLEAAQVTANKERDVFIATLSKPEQEKFKAVEKAVRILQKAGVNFYLFPELESMMHLGKKQIWQWNSLMEKIHLSKKGEEPTESEKENARFHEAFFTLLFNQFSPNFGGKTTEESLTKMPYFFYYCMIKNAEYFAEKE